jgi:LysM domain
VPSDEIQQIRSVGTAPMSWVRSAVTSALLAIAAIAPAASVAAEPDTSQEGSAPEQVVDPESDSPSFDPGGDTELPYDTGPPATSPEDSPDAAPLEGEPTDDPEGRAAPFAEPHAPAPTGPEDAPARPLEEPPPAPSAPGFSIEPPPPAPGAPLALPPERLPAEPASHAKSRRQTWTVIASVDRSPSGDGVVTSEAEPTATPITAGAAAVTRPVATQQSEETRARFHTVRPGESLWSIAEDLLASDASTTSIAAEVARLWELNRDRIPSGDPDLIEVGQRLELR